MCNGKNKSNLFSPVKTENVVLSNQFVESFFQFSGKQLPPGFGERGGVHFLLQFRRQIKVESSKFVDLATGNTKKASLYS